MSFYSKVSHDWLLLIEWGPIIPLGLRRVETGALIKDYEAHEKEIEMALQMTVTDVLSEDPRYIEKTAAPLNEEYSEGTNVIFLGEHAYGVAARVNSTTDTSLSVILAVCVCLRVLFETHFLEVLPGGEDRSGNAQRDTSENGLLLREILPLIQGRRFIPSLRPNFGKNHLKPDGRFIAWTEDQHWSKTQV